MSKRPAFQFYPADWRNNAKLRRCSPAARGVWMDILCLLHDADEYGVLRWPLKDIAQAAGASAALVRELVTKGVLKGADKDASAYVYRPTHAGKMGEPVTLVIADGGPVWYCSRFVRDEWIRQRRGSSTRFDGDNQPPKGTPKESPKPPIGERPGDGPSTTSSASHSEANASGAAAAPPPVDKSTNPENPPPAPAPATDSAKRAAWRDCGNWLVANGVAEVTAREIMGKVLKDFPAVALEAFVAAPKQAETPNPSAYLVATAKALDDSRSKAAKSLHPTPTAEETAEALRRQAEERQRPADPEAQAAIEAAAARVKEVRDRLAGVAA